jgi:hypothetical protein
MTSGQSGSGFSVVIAQLRTHAGVLDQVANAMGQASDAAQRVTLSDTAFGQLPVSSSFANLVRMVSAPGVAALSQAQTSVSSTSTTISATADNYEAVEQGNTTAFTKISDDTAAYTPLGIGKNVDAVVSINPNGGTA